MKKGMAKVSVMYANGEGKTFDMDYYTEVHMPLVQKLLCDALKGSSIEKGLGGAAPGSTAPYAGIGIMYFNSVRDFGQAFAPHSKEITGNLSNFNSIKPLVQISEIIG